MMGRKRKTPPPSQGHEADDPQAPPDAAAAEFNLESKSMLIAEIRKRHAIWNAFSIEKRDRTMIDNSWEAVADAMGIDGRYFSSIN
jgi:hypothetical protein